MPNATLAQMGFVDENEQEVVYDLEDTQSRTDISTINGKIPSAASSTNKLVDTTAMNDAIGQAVSAVYKPGGNKTVAELTSSLLIADNRGKVYNMTDAGTTTADFIEGAGKPIKIGDEVGICEPTTGTFKFNMLSGIIPVDTNPTSGSANAVSSGGVYSALDGKISKSSSAGYVKNDGTIDTELATTVANKVDKVAGKGLSTNDYNNTAKGIVDNIQDNVKANTQLIKDTVGWSGKNKFNPSAISLNGQYATLNSDGSSIEVKVTTAETYRSTSWIMPVERNTNYIISSIVDFVSGGGYVLVKTPDDSANIWASAQFTSDGEINASFNSGANDSVLIKMFCTLATSEVGDVIYKNFMIRKAVYLDPTYEPYFGSTAFPRSEQAVLGAKNLWSSKLDSAVSVKSGTTYTYADGVYTINCNTTDYAGIYWSTPNTRPLLTNYTGVKAILSFDVKADASMSAVIGIDGAVTLTTEYQHYEYDITDLSQIPSITFYSRDTSNARTINVKNMMIRLASDPDDTYVPYAMTNKELTEKKVDKVTAILTSNDDLDDIMESGLYNITSKPANSPNQWCTMLVIGGRNDNISQIIFRDYGNDGFIYIRSHGGNPAVWQPWIKFTGTVVS